MGMMVGSSTNRQTYQIKDSAGNVKATISKSKSSKKKKRLNYNYKKISQQITMTKTSGSTRRVVTRAVQEVVSLLRKQHGGDYDENELRRAIIHARKMERISRKKMKHLQEEEKAKQSGECLVEKKEEENDEKNIEGAMDGQFSEEELKEMLAEYEDMLNEMQKENGLDEIMEEYMGASVEDMSSEDLDKLRKKHRADELRQIMEADMKYLQSLFNQLEKDKQSASNMGVSLQLEGMDMPVQVSDAAVMPAEAEGASVDVSL